MYLKHELLLYDDDKQLDDSKKKTCSVGKKLLNFSTAVKRLKAKQSNELTFLSAAHSFRLKIWDFVVEVCIE